MFGFIKRWRQRKALEWAKRKWLADLATIFNKHGPDSKEALDFLATAPDEESKKLGELSLDLKKALCRQK